MAYTSPFRMRPNTVKGLQSATPLPMQNDIASLEAGSSLVYFPETGGEAKEISCCGSSVSCDMSYSLYNSR